MKNRKNQFSFFFIISLFQILNYSHAQNINLISPNGNEILKSGERYSISWNAKDVKTVSFYYSSDDENWIKIDEGIISDLKSYSWKVPQINKPIKIKISDYDNIETFDVSDNFVLINNNLQDKIFSLHKKTIDPVKIMPLGNSITFDTRKNDTRVVGDRIGYRFPLYNLLNISGYNFEFIGSEHSGVNYFSPNSEYDANAGFPGIKATELANLLITGRRYQPFYGIDQQITAGPYLETYSPNIILLHIGTNNNENPIDGTSPVYVEQILDEIDRFEQVNNTEVIVIIARIINRVPNETFVTTLNENVVAMALDRVYNQSNDAYPDKVWIVDMEDGAEIDYSIDYMGTIGNGIFGDMSDALHPNDKGYAKMANVWYNAIDSVLNAPIIINEQPATLYVLEGNSVEFKVSATSYLPLSFQWKKNGIELLNENDSVLSISNITGELNKSEYTCQISTWGKSVESSTAVLNITNENSRVASNQLVLYRFSESNGKIINDSAEELTPLNLSIISDSSFEWFYNSLKIKDSIVIRSQVEAKKLYDSLTNADEISVELWLKPQNINQNGPARILSYSQSRLERNFGLLQNGDRYEFRLRTTTTDNNGTPSLISNAGLTAENLTHFVYTLSKDDTAKMYINGILENKIYLSGSFQNWDSTYLFGIANEINESKPWLGNYYLLAVFNRALSNSEVIHNYSLGISGFANVISPNNLLIGINQQSNIDLSWTDNSSDEMGFKILRKNNELQNFIFIDSVSSNITQYSDNVAEEGKTHSYCIVAYNNLGISESSNIKNVYKLLPNPTNLSGFVNIDGNVELNWEDESKSEAGFIVESKPSVQDSNYKIIGTVYQNEVSFIDTTSKYISPYLYRVYAYTNDTISEKSNELIIDVVNVKSSKNQTSNYKLFQNYPNPFNASTNIQYIIPEEAYVQLTVYTLLGQPVKILVDKKQSLGNYTIIFDAKNMASGIYYYRLKTLTTANAKEFESFKKLIVLK